MWIPRGIFDLFAISKETVDSQREELAAVKSERDYLVRELATTKANFAWITVRVNALEEERAVLLEKAYGVKISVPEIRRSNPNANHLQDINNFSFDHVDEDTARKLGIGHLLS